MVIIEIPKDNVNGDYSTNIAMRLTRVLKRRPQEIAEELREALAQKLPEAEKIEIAGPGFINFWIRKDAMANIINVILTEGDDYGKSDYGKYLKKVVSDELLGGMYK